MRKMLLTLALAAVPGLMMSACNGGGTGSTGVSTLPSVSHHGKVQRNDNSSNDLHAGGATFPGYGYNLGDQPTGLYTDSQPTPGPGSLMYNAAQAKGDGNSYYYCLTGSGAGRKQFYGSTSIGASACAALGASPTGFGARGNQLDFAGSDAALLTTECCASGTPYATNYGSTNGQPFEVPSFGGPLVFPYINAGSNGLTGLGSSQLKLSLWTYCAISNGTITNWDDAAITADNNGNVVANSNITFVYRSDGSGTTYLFTTKLNTDCNAAHFKGKYLKAPYQSGGRDATWTGGVDLSGLHWTGPTCNPCSAGNAFVGASGNPGVLQTIQGLSGSCYPFCTGYAEGAWAAAASSPSVLQAALQSGSTFVSPTNQLAVANALAKASAAKIVFGGAPGNNTPNALGGSTPNCQLYIDPSAFVNPPAGAYPIVGLSYLLFYGKGQVSGSSSHFGDIKSLIQYMDSSTFSSSLPGIEYSPLPASTQKKVQKALTGSRLVPACLAS